MNVPILYRSIQDHPLVERVIDIKGDNSDIVWLEGSHTL